MRHGNGGGSVLAHEKRDGGNSSWLAMAFDGMASCADDHKRLVIGGCGEESVWIATGTVLLR